MMDVLVGLILVGLGFFAGRKSAENRRLPARPQEQERQQLLEDRAAFSQLMGYNADRAYGRIDD